MSLDQLAVTLYLTVHGQHSPDRTAVATLAAMFALQLAVGLILWRVFRRGGADGDDPGSGGDGPGWRRRPGRRRMGPIAFPIAQKTVAQSALTLTTVQPSPAA